MPRLLEVHRFLFRFGLGAGTVFAWVFVFQYYVVATGDPAAAFARTALLYALGQTVVALITPLSARLLRNGTRHALIDGTLAAALAFVVLGGVFAGMLAPGYIPLALTVFALALGLYRALYWIPYVVVAEKLQTRSRAWREFTIALAPAVGGIILVSTTGAPETLFLLTATMLTLSALPLRRAQNALENFSWKYRETFMHLIARENRPLIVPALMDGVVGSALLFVWPIAAFLIVGWSYSMLGIVLSLSLLAGMLLRRIMRRAVRRTGGSPLIEGAVAVSPWILRLVVGTPLGIVLVDSYFYSATPRRHGIDPFTFEQASDAGSYIDEHTALKEIALSLGRLFMCVLSAVIALTATLSVALAISFGVAALMTLLAIVRQDR